jgi:hypothetical protein
MPIKRIRPSKLPKPIDEPKQEEPLEEKIENLFLPDETEFVKQCPIVVKLYNLFEKKLPTTGHVAVTVASALASMCIKDIDRQFNFVFGAPAGQGKTVLLKQFCSLTWLVNYMNRTTYADYMLMFCGKFLKKAGREIPYGVKYDRRLKVQNLIDTSEAPDFITNRFDIIGAGESIFTTSDLPKLLQFWNTILEEGYYKGGDRYSGHYEIGSPSEPVRHGLILASTIDDFDRHILTSIGWSSRCVLGIYYNTEEENEYIRYGLRFGHIKDQPVFHLDVKRLLNHLIPNHPVDVKYESDEIPEMLRECEEALKVIRREVPGIRATKDVKRFVKGFAWLNGYRKVKYYHVVFVNALIQSLCRRLRVGESTGYKNLGSRLHFQVALRRMIYDNDVTQITKSIMDTFKTWKGYELYDEQDIRLALEELNAPIEPIVSVPLKQSKLT